MSQSSFTVFFEDPFWVGVYQQVEDGRLAVCKVTFGSEPTDGEVYQFLLDNWQHLVFSLPVATEKALIPQVGNPKRAQRNIAKSMKTPGVGTKAQNALKLAHAAGKLARKAKTRQAKQQNQERRFLQRTKKRKEKHRGH